MVFVFSFVNFLEGLIKFKYPEKNRRKGVPKRAIKDEGIFWMGFAIAIATLDILLITIPILKFIEISLIGFASFIFFFLAALCFRKLRVRVGKPRAGHKEGLIFSIIGGSFLIVCFWLYFIL